MTPWSPMTPMEAALIAITGQSVSLLIPRPSWNWHRCTHDCKCDPPTSPPLSLTPNKADVSSTGQFCIASPPINDQDGECWVSRP